MTVPLPSTSSEFVDAGISHTFSEYKQDPCHSLSPPEYSYESYKHNLCEG
jgi:hypothetical protein